MLTIRRLTLFTLLAMASCDHGYIAATNRGPISMIQPLGITRQKASSTARSADPVQQWVYRMQHTSGLMESSEGTNFVSLYDNALSAIYFINRGNKERAERIFDFYDNRMRAELLAEHGGFYQFRTTAGTEGRNKWLGDNAWLLLALNRYEDTYGSSKYKNMQVQLEGWIRSLQEYDGGLIGGHREDGTAYPKVTEAIIMAFIAVRGYDAFHANILTYLKNERWDANMNVLMSWPENKAYRLALDVHTLGSLIFKDMANALLAQAGHFKTTQVLSVSGEEIEGYCFDGDKDVVWLEGTAQMAVALRSANRPLDAEKLLGHIERSFINSPIYKGTIGVPYASNNGTSYESSILWGHADTAPALSATLWYLFAKEKLNPMALGTAKQIPAEDQFWNEGAENKTPVSYIYLKS